MKGEKFPSHLFIHKKLIGDEMEEKKVLIEITGSVFDSDGPVTGKVEMEVNEAARLVDLKVAKFVDVQVPPGTQISDQDDDEPDMGWKKEEICLFLDEKKIPFDEKSTKEVLIGVYEEWKAKISTSQS